MSRLLRIHEVLEQCRKPAARGPKPLFEIVVYEGMACLCRLRQWIIDLSGGLFRASASRPVFDAPDPTSRLFEHGSRVAHPFQHLSADRRMLWVLVQASGSVAVRAGSLLVPLTVPTIEASLHAARELLNSAPLGNRIMHTRTLPRLMIHDGHLDVRVRYAFRAVCRLTRERVCALGGHDYLLQTEGNRELSHCGDYQCHKSSASSVP